MRVTKEYLRNVIKESIEEVASAAAAEYELEELEEAEDKEPSDYAAEIQRGYTLHVYKNGKEVIEKPKGGHVSADELEKLKMLKGFRSDLAAAKARAKKAGYGK